jgi:hypothetical protein
MFFDDMRPIAGTATGTPPLDRIRGILFVIDLTNTPAGRSGRIWIKDAAIER